MRLALIVIASVAALAPNASAADDSAYTASVQRAQQLVVKAQEGNATAARQALAELRQGTGSSQPEILADLSRQPPDLEDASTRLQALSTALASPADVADPGA